MRKDFNVYQWRRDHLFENKETTPQDLLKKFQEEIKGAFLKEKDKYIETENRGSSKEEEKVKKLFLDHGYTLSKVEEIEGEPGERLNMVRYYFKK